MYVCGLLCVFAQGLLYLSMFVFLRMGVYACVCLRMIACAAVCLCMFV